MKKHARKARTRTPKRPIRKATAREQRELGLPADCTIETVDLHDPNLTREHRDRFIASVKAEVARLDELVGAWYRHRGECDIEGCDCGGTALAEQVEMMCGHLYAIKQLFGEIIIDDHRNFARMVKELGENDAYAALTAMPRAQ